MEDKPLSPKWFIQAMALLAVAGMTIPLVAGVSGFIKDELRRPTSIERGR
jgi:fructose-specific phosphotransferase system IIC component